MQVINFSFTVILIEIIHLQVPRSLVLIGPHVGETQRAIVAVVKVGPGFSPLIGTRHKAPVRCQQGLPGWLNITRTRPGWAELELSSRFIKTDTALIAGPIFIICFIARRECNFVRVTAFAAFRHFNRGKSSNINTEHVSRITRLEVEVGVPGGVRKVGFIFVVIGHIFTVTHTLPVIDAAG